MQKSFVILIYLALYLGSGPAWARPDLVEEQLGMGHGQVEGGGHLGLNSSRENAASLVYARQPKLSLDTAMHRRTDHEQTSSLGLLIPATGSLYAGLAYSYSTLPDLERLLNWALAVRLGDYMAFGVGAVVQLNDMLSTARAGVILNPDGFLRLGTAGYNLNSEPVGSVGISLHLPWRTALAFERLYNETGQVRSLSAGLRLTGKTLGLSLAYERSTTEPLPPPAKRFLGSLCLSNESSVLQLSYRLRVAELYFALTTTFF